jgi:hypothetical protein
MFLRRLGLGAPARAFGSLLFAFNPNVLNYMAYSNAWAFAWFPWLLWAFERMACDRSRWGAPSVLIALMGMSGHVEDAFFGATAFCLYGFVRHLQQQSRSIKPGPWLMVAITSLGLSAWWVLPFVEYIFHSWSPRFAANIPFPYHPSAMFIPGSEIYWSPALVLLAAAGWSVRRYRRTAWAILPAVLWGTAMMFPWPQLVQRAATFDFASGRYGRGLVWTGLIIWAALGVDGLARDEVGRKGRWPAAAVAVVCGVAGSVVTIPSIDVLLNGQFVPLTGEKVPLLGWMTALCILAVLLAISGTGRWVAPMTLAVALASLALASQVFVHPVLDVSWNRSQPRLAAAVAHRAPREPGRMWFPDRNLWRSLPPNLSALWGLRDVRYCAPIVPLRLARLDPKRTAFKDLFGDWEPERSLFLGVTTAWHLDESKANSLVPSEAVGQRGRAFWVGRAEAVSSPSEGVEHALAGAAWKQVAFVEGPVSGGEGPTNAEPRGEVRPLEDGATASRWLVEATKPGWLILRDLHYPGWKALVDGRPVPLYAADGVFRAVRLEAGSHEVAFRYRPISLFLGVILTLLTIVGLAVLWTVHRASGQGGVP